MYWNPIKKLAGSRTMKLIAQKAISMVPGEAGFRLNEKMVKLVRGEVENRIDFGQRFTKGVRNMEMLQKEAGFSLENKTVLELGTGWHCIDLLLFWLLGSKKLYTIDHHLHTSTATIKSIWINLDLDFAKEVLKSLNVDEDRLTSKVNYLAEALSQDYNTLADFFKKFDIEFLKRRSCIIEQTEFKESVDLFYSESVLQRIPWSDLEDSIQHISNQMTPGGISFHKIDQKDINALDHVDKELWHLDYLKYSDFRFGMIMTRFNYQNRMRESDFVDLFNKNGLKTIQVKSLINDEDIQRMGKMKLPARFENYEIKDLAIHSSYIISRKNGK